MDIHDPNSSFDHPISEAINFSKKGHELKCQELTVKIDVLKYEMKSSGVITRLFHKLGISGKARELKELQKELLFHRDIQIKPENASKANINTATAIERIQSEIANIDTAIKQHADTFAELAKGGDLKETSNLEDFQTLKRKSFVLKKHLAALQSMEKKPAEITENSINSHLEELAKLRSKIKELKAKAKATIGGKIKLALGIGQSAKLIKSETNEKRKLMSAVIHEQGSVAMAKKLTSNELLGINTRKLLRGDVIKTEIPANFKTQSSSFKELSKKSELLQKGETELTEKCKKLSDEIDILKTKEPSATKELDSLEASLKDMESKATQAGLESNKVLKELKKTKDKYLNDLRVNSEAIFKSLVDQIPSITVNPSKDICHSSHQEDVNNYGLSIDGDIKISKTSTDKGSEQIVVSFKLPGDGTEYQARVPPAMIQDGIKKLINSSDFADGTNLKLSSEAKIFISPEDAEYCDKAQRSTKVSGAQVMTLTDGSGEAKKGAKVAAEVAAVTTQQYVENALEKGAIKTLQDGARVMLEGIEVTRKALLEKVDDEGNLTAGSTTFAQVLAIDGYALVASVGDCSVFILRGDNVIHVNEGARDVITDTRDAGGQLTGSFGEELAKGKDHSDFRNLQLCAVKLLPGDIIMSCSDGVIDNLDPQKAGLKPSQCGGVEDLWLETDDHAKLKSSHISKELAKLQKESSGSVETLGKSISTRIEEQTKFGKVRLLQDKPLHSDEYWMKPKDGEGKPDHASAIYMKIA